MTITILAVGGTTESHPGDTRTYVPPGSMLRSVTDHLDYRDYMVKWVGYPATYGPVGLPGITGPAYRASLNTGVVNLAARVDDTPGPIVLLGYSQGAAVIDTYLDHLTRGGRTATLRRIAGVVLVANPGRPPGTGIPGHAPAGHGLTWRPDTGRTVATDALVPVLEVAHPGDAICSAPDDSPLRDLAALTEFFTLTDLRGWASKVRGELGRASLRVDWRDLPRHAARYWRAAQDVTGFITGQHTLYPVDRIPGSALTYSEFAARWITQVAGTGTAAAA